MLPAPAVKSIDLSGLPLGNEIVVTRTYLKDLKEIRDDLKKQVDEFWIHIGVEMKQKEIEKQRLVASEESRKVEALKDADVKLKDTLDAVNFAQSTHLSKVAEINRSHDSRMRSLEADFQGKLTKQGATFQELVQERQSLHSQWGKEMTERAHQSTNEINELTSYYASLQADAEKQLQLAESEMILSQKVWQQCTTQVEKDLKNHISTLREEHMKVLAAVREDKQRLRGQVGVHKKQHENLEDQISNHKAELSSLHAATENSEARIRALQLQLDAQYDTLGVQEKILAGKNSAIQTLRGRIAELDKFKFVLSEKIRDLQSQIEPKNVALVKLKNQIKVMGDDLLLCHQRSQAMYLQISEFKRKYELMHAQLDGFNALTISKQATVRDFQRRVADIALGDLDDSESLRNKINQLLDTFTASKSNADDAVKRKMSRLSHEQKQLELEILTLTGAAEMDQIVDMGLAGQLLAAEEDMHKSRAPEDLVTREIINQSDYLSNSMRLLQRKQIHDFKAEGTALNEAVAHNSKLITEIESLRTITSALRQEWLHLKASKTA